MYRQDITCGRGLASGGKCKETAIVDQYDVYRDDQLHGHYLAAIHRYYRCPHCGISFAVEKLNFPPPPRDCLIISAAIMR
jgi:hypothetical protein